MKKQLVWLIALLCWTMQVRAQQRHSFTQGLVAGPCHQYGREALYTDQLAYSLIQGQLPKPVAGKSVAPGELAKLTWTPVATSEKGQFKEGMLGNGYLYLTYQSPKEQVALLHATGHSMVYVNGVPHVGDPYASGWLYIPVKLRKGENELMVRTSASVRYQGINAELIFPDKHVTLNTEDPTLPSIVPGQTTEPIWGAVVVINTSAKPLANLQIRSQLAGKTVATDLLTVPAMTTRKVGFRLDASGVQQVDKVAAQLQLMQAGKVLDTAEVSLFVGKPEQQYSQTFISDIDGSVQYFSVAPQRNADGKAPALFLSVHGAGVEAINQARAYKPKDWGVVVTPTNRRPRGFNWEDWGRLDALEVLGLAKKQFAPDPERIYLTGHSMGGHGTWYLGATFPGNWAAIAPCAGYPSLAAYGSHDGKIPETGDTDMERLLLRASNPSNVLALASNYKPLGVYILHGDADRTVSVEYARQMRQLLGTFHPDFTHYEYPGGSHWYGDHSVDWQPIFDYFRWHKIPRDSAVSTIDFKTANPAISATMRWATIEQQQHPLQFSRVQLTRNKTSRTISGTTQNVGLLALDLSDFAPGETITVTLDSLKAVPYTVKASNEVVYLARNDQWETRTKSAPAQKGKHRNGTFKEPFNNRMVLVYATSGTADENNWAENKARYDAETWYYRGNGAVDIVADKDFDLKKFADRGVVLYGNATTNKAWNALLATCPIQVRRGEVVVGNEHHSGNDLGAYFVWPRPDSQTASIAVVTGTGLPGMKAADANQYFAGGSGFADFMLFRTDMLTKGIAGVMMAGFFDNNWLLSNQEFVKNVLK
jgi:pimeloyl-ACP methyl ester carboxylesterase